MSWLNSNPTKRSPYLPTIAPSSRPWKCTRPLSPGWPAIALPVSNGAYACRAGTATPFSFGANITPEQVNYDGDHPYAGGEKGLNRGKTVAVKSLSANRWGLYEMHGNVWEWCQDVWQDNLGTAAVVDPLTLPDAGTGGGPCAARRLVDPRRQARAFRHPWPRRAGRSRPLHRFPACPRSY
ncbi:SUMF1/EgtB/PvdO family nonheme iron enzyme [Methylococcaceae bacterium WWC4]|nr:SUMF1/EgtB/PvdO family nonheme iron enzyme [Methylococcaceae bacterium WWC4]